MAQSQLNLYNLAASIMGEPITIAAVDEETVLAEDLNLWYENVRQTVLRAAHWASCERFAKLSTEIADRSDNGDWVAGDPHPEFAYAYAVPSNCLAVRHLSTYARFRIGYEASTDNAALYCNEEDPVLVYTVDQTDVTKWEPDLYKAIAYGLAAHVTSGRTGKRSKSADVINMANQIILEARAATANEQGERMRQPIAESLAERGHTFQTGYGYIAPYGSLLVAAGIATK